jgi:hypothetical protein
MSVVNTFDNSDAAERQVDARVCVHVELRTAGEGALIGIAMLRLGSHRKEIANRQHTARFDTVPRGRWVRGRKSSTWHLKHGASRTNQSRRRSSRRGRPLKRAPSFLRFCYGPPTLGTSRDTRRLYFIARANRSGRTCIAALGRSQWDDMARQKHHAPLTT